MTVPCASLSILEQGSVVIRQLRSITPAQVGIVAQAVATHSPAWRVERHDDYDGYLSLVVSLDDHDAPTFAISGAAGQIELCEVRGDALYARGNFSTMGETAGVLVQLLQGTGL